MSKWEIFKRSFLNKDCITCYAFAFFVSDILYVIPFIVDWIRNG